MRDSTKTIGLRIRRLLFDEIETWMRPTEFELGNFYKACTLSEVSSYSAVCHYKSLKMIKDHHRLLRVEDIKLQYKDRLEIWQQLQILDL